MEIIFVQYIIGMKANRLAAMVGRVIRVMMLTLL